VVAVAASSVLGLSMVVVSSSSSMAGAKEWCVACAVTLYQRFFFEF
jgi:hypothetical protein